MAPPHTTTTPRDPTLYALFFLVRMRRRRRRIDRVCGACYMWRGVCCVFVCGGGFVVSVGAAATTATAHTHTKKCTIKSTLSRQTTQAETQQSAAGTVDDGGDSLVWCFVFCVCLCVRRNGVWVFRELHFADSSKANNPGTERGALLSAARVLC